MQTTKSTRVTNKTVPHTEVTKGMPVVSYLMFTPQECKDFLAEVEKDGRRVQRPLSHKKIQSFATAMQEGRWRADSVEPVKFDEEGLLMDGFHRMNAVIRAGIPVVLCMAQGVPKAVESVLDSGTARNASHSLWMMGYRYTTCLATTCRTIWLLEHRIWKMESYVDNQLVIATATRFQNIQAYVAQSWNHTFVRAGSVVGALFWIELCNPERGSLFTEGLLHGTLDGKGLESSSIVYLLREALIRDRGGYMNSFNGRNMIVATIFRTYARFLTGETVSRIRLSLEPDKYHWPEGGPYA